MEGFFLWLYNNQVCSYIHVCLFIHHWRTFRLLRPWLGYCEQCCHEQDSTDISLRCWFCFLWMYLQSEIMSYSHSIFFEEFPYFYLAMFVPVNTRIFVSLNRHYCFLSFLWHFLYLKGIKCYIIVLVCIFLMINEVELLSYITIFYVNVLLEKHHLNQII